MNWPLNTTVDLNWLIWKLISSFVNYLVSQPWLDARFCHDEIPWCVLSTSRIRRWCWSFCGRSWRSGKRGADAEPCHLSKWRTWPRPRVTCARAEKEVKASPARLTVPSSRSGRKTMCLRKEEEGEEEDWAVRDESRWENMRRIVRWLGGTSEQGSMFPLATSGRLLFLTLVFLFFFTRSGE